MCEKCGYDAGVFGLTGSCADARDELFAFTLGRPRPPFIHQLAVDAYSAQHLDETCSKIARLFPLMGLCMVCEKGATGYQVQIAHQAKSEDRNRPDWPLVEIRPSAFRMNVGHVLDSASSEELEASILRWAESTWAAYSSVHGVIREFCR